MSRTKKAAVFLGDLESLRASFEAQVDILLEKAQRDYVKPFCDKHNAKFIAGMGSFSFVFASGKEDISGWNDDLLPKDLREVLQAAYPLNDRQGCGSMMPDYTPPNWKPKGTV